MKKILGTILGILLTTTVAIAANTTPGQGNQGGFNADTRYVQGYGVIGTDGQEDESNPRLIQTIQNTVNRILGILSLIALILCLRGGFQMLTAAGDDGKVKTGTKILKQAAIGLVVIGLSWILVSFIFRLINRTQRPG